MSRRRKHHEEEEHENHERWLVSYADMITVLMALFIVLYAMSQVDESKYQELKASLRAGFGNSGAMMHNSTSILDGQDRTMAAAIAPDDVAAPLSAEQLQLVSQVAARNERMRLSRAREEAQREARRLTEVMERLRAALIEHGLEEDVRTTIDDRGLVLSLVSEHVVFDANYATLTDRGREVVDTLTPVLRQLPDPLQIDGHTNQVDVKPKYYPTDWDLSAARAITVLRHLNEVGGIPNARMAAAAYGMEKPLRDPSEPGSQEVNKRVDIVVLTSLDAEARQLLTEQARDLALALPEGGRP